MIKLIGCRQPPARW